MSRTSCDEFFQGRVWNGFDYALQVWVKDGFIQPCGHPEWMRRDGPCCDAPQLAGLLIYEVDGAQER